MAELAVGRDLEANLFLLLDDLLDLAVLNVLELRVGDLFFLVLDARLLDRRGAQQTADHVGTEWRLASLRHHFLRKMPASLDGHGSYLRLAIARPGACVPCADSHA